MRVSTMRMCGMGLIAGVLFGAGVVAGAFLKPDPAFAQSTDEENVSSPATGQELANADYFRDAAVIVQFTTQHVDERGPAVKLWLNGHVKDRVGSEVEDVWTTLITRYEEPMLLGFTPEGRILFHRMSDVGDQQAFKTMLEAWWAEGQ